MLTRITIPMIVALALLLAAPTVAQEMGDGTRVPVLSAPTFITIPEGEPLALYVRDVKNKTASAVVLVETADGYVQMTPCDNVEIVCEDVEIPAAGTEQGDLFFLGSE